MARGPPILLCLPTAGQESALQHRHAQQHEPQRVECDERQGGQPLPAEQRDMMQEDAGETAAIDFIFAANGRMVGVGKRRDEIGETRTDMAGRSEEHTSELQSLMRISYAVFCLKKTNKLENRGTSHHDK